MSINFEMKISQLCLNKRRSRWAMKLMKMEERKQICVAEGSGDIHVRISLKEYWEKEM